jgi:hypothetical protein
MGFTILKKIDVFYILPSKSFYMSEFYSSSYFDLYGYPVEVTTASNTSEQ